MIRIFCQLAICIFTSFLLSACAHSYNPQTTSLSVNDQCTALQRQMLFGNNYSINSSQWSNQVDQHQLQKQFHELNCYKVLNETKAS